MVSNENRKLDKRCVGNYINREIVRERELRERKPTAKPSPQTKTIMIKMIIKQKIRGFVWGIWSLGCNISNAACVLSSGSKAITRRIFVGDPWLRALIKCRLVPTVGDRKQAGMKKNNIYIYIYIYVYIYIW